MSEVTTAAETEATEAEVKEPVTTPEQEAALAAYDAIWQIFKNVADEANALQKQYTDATKGVDDAVESVLNESEDETITKWREWRKSLVEKIEAAKKSLEEGDAKTKEHAKSLVPAVAETDVDATKAAYLEKRKAADLTGKNLLALVGGDEATFKAGLNKYGITEVIGLRRNSTTTGASDIVRKRIASATVDGEPFADSKGKVSFTTLQTKTGVDGSVLRDAAAKAAGVESVRDIPAGTTVEFTVTSGNKTHQVSITTPDAD